MSRAWWTLLVLLSHWRRHPTQLATLLVGLIAATALWSGVQALNQQARISYDRAASVLGGSRLPMLLPVAGNTMPQGVFVALRREGWPVSPLLESRVEIGGRSVRLLGIEPLTLPAQAFAATSGLRAPSEAPGEGALLAFLAPPGQSLAAPETLADLKLREGDTPALSGGTLPPLRAAPDMPPGLITVDIGVAQRVLNRPGEISRLLLSADAAARTPPTEIAGARLRLVPAEGETDLERLTDSFHLNLTAFGLLSFAVGLFIVNAAIGLAFEQRRPTLRTLRACGISARLLSVVLTAELVVFALLAGLAGLVCGYLIAGALLPDVAASLRGLYGAQIPGELSLAPRWWLAGIAISLVGALAAATGSLVRAARLPLLATAQPQAWQEAQRRWLNRQAIAALLLFAGALAAWLFGESLASAFAVLGGLLIGAALLLPAVLARLLRTGERMARGALLQWFWADTRQQLSGLSLALMALLLALAVNVGVSTMVESFSRTFRIWLEGRLAADVYINAADDAQGRQIVGWLKSRDDVRAILPGARADVTLGGMPAEIIAFADHPIYRDQWPLLDAAPDAWDRVARGDAALASEQLARRIGLRVGERLEVETATGRWPLTIAAIYADYGNPKGQLGVNITALQSHFPQAPRTRFGVITTPGHAASLVAELRGRFALDERSLSDQASLKAESLRIFNRTFAVTGALNSFTLGVAAVALLTSLLTLGTARLPQLAPLWALGLTRRSLALLELAKTLALALFTALLALPLGVLVAWCLIAVVNVKAFGWRLPLHVFPFDMIALLTLAMAAAGLAAALPLLRLMRMQPADLARVFAHER
jgi:putative ABC transport system permease protein